MIKNLKPRIYQQTIFNTCVNYNTLVVLPTGLGKTMIAVMMIAQRLMQYPKSKCIILSPTKPLAEQIQKVCQNHLQINEEEIVLFTGAINAKKREELFKSSKVIVSTPQGMENDILNKKISIEEVSLIVFDEAHRAVGDYSYVWIAEYYQKYSRYPRILALTASPGSDLEKINEIINNLSIEEIELRSDQDYDVKPYIQEVDIKWVYVELGEELKKIKKYLDSCVKNKIKQIADFGLAEKGVDYSTKMSILRLQKHLQSEISQGNRDFDVLKSLSLLAEIMKTQHAQELLESQGITPLLVYLNDIRKKAVTSNVKAVQNLVRDPDFRSAYILTEKAEQNIVEHPKIKKLRDIIEDNKDKKIIIFTQFRDTGKHIVDNMNAINGIRAELFVGQAKKKQTGLSQKEQIEMLDKFRNDEFNVLVSSSVGEEGLDIPQVDIVIFFEPIPSAIRHIQRRGRTGRHGKGQLMILATKETRDIGYKWSAHHKEIRMHRILQDVKKTIKLQNNTKQKTLENYNPKNNYNDTNHKINPDVQSVESVNRVIEGKTINPENVNKLLMYVDHREKASNLIKNLMTRGVDIRLVHLDSADYMLSSDVGVEFKTQDDFITSLLDGRLFEQLIKLKQTYKKPLIIVEGSSDIYNIRNVHPNAIRGLISSIVVGFNIPFLQTKNSNETTEYMYTIMKKEQEKASGIFTPHSNKKTTSTKEQQEYIVSSFPGVGPLLSKPLLHKFKNIKSIVNASVEELKEVKLIGEKKAEKIRNIFDEEYKP